MPLDDTTNYKTCNKCGVEYPATAEYFYRDKKLGDGLGNSCKPCIKEYGHQRYLENADLTKKRVRDAYWNNPELAKARVREYAYHHPQEIRQQHHDYYLRNRDKLLERARLWRLNNKEQHQLNARSRKARQLEAEGSYRLEDVKKIYDLQSGMCWWCLKDVGDTYHIDHRIPLSRGGTNWPSNIVIACPSCNLEKNKSLPSEWIGRLL